MNALELWERLVASERSDVGSGITGATLRFLGPNGERHEELEVSSTFSKGGGGMGAVPSHKCHNFDGLARVRPVGAGRVGNLLGFFVAPRPVPDRLSWKNPFPLGPDRRILPENARPPWTLAGLRGTLWKHPLFCGV